MTAVILEVRDIHTYYGSSHVIFGLSLAVGEGEVVCLLGRNGAGKTTTLRSIMGLTPPRSGSVRLRGVEVRGKPPFRIAQLGMSLVFADRRIVPELTVEENLLLGQRKLEGRRWNAEKIYEIFPDLGSLKNHLGGKLSGGQQQMLTIGRTLMCNPTVLLMDEPAEGLAPVIVNNLMNQIRVLVQERQTILLAEQNLRFATEISSRAYIIEKGSIQFEGEIQELKQNSEIQRKYLAV
jgi:branched-chain amino acid transport system ATP-binding protein